MEMKKMFNKKTPEQINLEYEAAKKQKEDSDRQIAEEKRKQDAIALQQKRAEEKRNREIRQFSLDKPPVIRFMELIRFMSKNDTTLVPPNGTIHVFTWGEMIKKYELEDFIKRLNEL